MNCCILFFVIVTAVVREFVSAIELEVSTRDYPSDLNRFKNRIKKKVNNRQSINHLQNATTRGKWRKSHIKRKKSLIDEKQNVFESRLMTNTTDWIQQHPHAKDCKDFSRIPMILDHFQTLVHKNKSVTKIPCIPAMILPVALDPYDLTARLFRSIDHCISNLYIYRSNEVDISEPLKNLDMTYVRRLIIKNHSFPIRLSQAWNSGIHELSMVSSWYLFCSNDVEFAPFQLGALNRKFWLKSNLLIESFVNDDASIDIAFFNWKNMPAGGYNLFAVKAAVFDKIGYFDENLHPAFFEDADMDRRVHNCNRFADGSCKVHTSLVSDICPWHGMHSHARYISGTRAYEEVNPKWPKFIDNAYAMNEKYFRAKWGCFEKTISPEACLFTIPFNVSDNTINHNDLGNWKFNDSRIHYMNSFLHL